MASKIPNSIAVMQPYFLPYLGYFQLIAVAEKFVFLDDVQFINRGWINRNYILVNRQKHLFTIPLIKASQNRLINSIQVVEDEVWRKKFLRTVQMSYGNRPRFSVVFPWLEQIIRTSYPSIGELAKASVRCVCERLAITTEFVESSVIYESARLAGAERIRDICVKENALVYLNLPGGRDLYSTQFFREASIDLRFLEPLMPPYWQGSDEFIPGLSILDALMNASDDELREMVSCGKVVA